MWSTIDNVSFPKPFPTELRAAFLDLLEPNDILGYSMASKTFNAEANRIRWRDYKFWFLPDGSGLDDACRPILRDPERARFVKSFSILMARPPSSSLSSSSSSSSSSGGRCCVKGSWTSSWSMFSAALSTITSVTKFSLGESSSPRAAPLRMLEHHILIQFLTCIQVWMAATPGIHTFSSRLDFCRTIPLLAACPSLRQVALHCGWELPTAAGRVPAYALPNLEEFEGDTSTVVTIAPGPPRLWKLSIHLSCPPRIFGDVLRQFRSLTTLRILQPPCPTNNMGIRLRHVGPIPSVQHLEYAYCEPESGTLTKGERLNGTNITDVLAPVAITFPSLRSCRLDCPAHPDDKSFPELMCDGPIVLAKLREKGDFQCLDLFTWNMGPGRDGSSSNGEDRLVRFFRPHEDDYWMAWASWYDE